MAPGVAVRPFWINPAAIFIPFGIAGQAQVLEDVLTFEAFSNECPPALGLVRQLMNPLGAAIALGLFYAVFLTLGIYVGRRATSGSVEGLLLANRRLPLVVGVATMTATWVGGGYIVGTAEAVFDSQRGLLWAQAPWCYAISLVLGGLFFARRMHEGKLTTLLDLFERRFGRRVAAVLYLPALCGELFWAAAILTALGSTTSTVLGLNLEASIVASAAVVITYTMAGGLKAVAYTDALQLICILFGLGFALYFASDGFSTLSQNWSDYQVAFGDLAKWRPPLSAFSTNERWGWRWLDFALLLILGGIPWQVYFQRVFACQTATQAMLLSILAGVGCMALAIPSILIGVIGADVDWAATSAGQTPPPAMVLPFVLRYLTPPFVATIGLAAIAAAVMSSVDSSLLSASSMFAWNVYRPLLNLSANDREITRVVRGSIIVLGLLATMMAIRIQSVYALWYMCAELVYVVLFPLLVVALFVRRVNGVGALTGAATGLLLRLGGGEPMIGLSPWLNYPWQSDAGTEFPFRTFSMVCGLLTTVAVSRLTLGRFPACELEVRTTDE